jgi:uncharacterized membrane protein required for colicin V production
MAAARLLSLAFIVLGLLIGMNLDLFWGIIFLCGGWFGWRGFKRGAIRALFALVGVICVFAWAIGVGKFIAPAVRWVFGLQLVPGRFLTIAAVAIAMIVFAQVLGAIASRRYQARHGQAGREARGIGLCCGLLEGGLFGLTLSLVTVALAQPVRMGLALTAEQRPWVRPLCDRIDQIQQHAGRAPLGRMLLARYAGSHRVLELGGSFAVLASYPEVLNTLKEHAIVETLIAENATIHRVVGEIKLDSALKKAAQSGDLRIMLGSTTVIRLLDDIELAKALDEHHDSLYAALLDSVPEAHREQAVQELAALHGWSVEESERFTVHLLATHSRRAPIRAQ